MKQEPAVTVVILNWNGIHWLEKFLPSVVATTYAQVEFLLIDNASTDESVDFVKSQYPVFRIVELEENYGFAEGNNRALPHVHTPYFVLLNSDVAVDPDWLQPLVQLMEAHPQAASVQPKIRAYGQKDHFEYAGAAGGFVDGLGYPYCRGRIFDYLEKDEGQYDTARKVFWATGACCLIRKSVVDEIGMFEPDFFAHMEEIDFCWRAQNYGYEIWCEPAAVVYHVGGGALAQGNPRKTYLNVRNSLSCMMRNLPQGQVFGKMLFRLLLDGVWAIRALLSWDWGTIGAIAKGHWHFFGQTAKWRRFRHQTYPNKIGFPQPGPPVFSMVWQYFIKGKKKFSDLS
jgi:GT2 family glycosyltransferase